LSLFHKKRQDNRIKQDVQDKKTTDYIKNNYPRYPYSVDPENPVILSKSYPIDTVEMIKEHRGAGAFGEALFSVGLTPWRMAEAAATRSPVRKDP